MVQKANITKNKSIQTDEAILPSSNLSQDLKNAVLIVSVVVNLFIFTAWIALQVTTQYDAQLANFLFTR